MKDFVFCFILLPGISSCLSFFLLAFICLFHIFVFFIPPVLLSPSQFFVFVFYPLRTLSVPEPNGAASSAHLLPRDLSGLPFAALLGWNLLRKDTWKVDCLKMSVSYTHTEGRLPGSK